MTFLLAEDPEASLAERETLILLWRPRSLVTHIAMGHTCVCVFFFYLSADPLKAQKVMEVERLVVVVFFVAVFCFVFFFFVVFSFVVSMNEGSFSDICTEN